MQLDEPQEGEVQTGQEVPVYQEDGGINYGQMYVQADGSLVLRQSGPVLNNQETG